MHVFFFRVALINICFWEKAHILGTVSKVQLKLT